MNLSPAFIGMVVAFLALGITFSIRASINAKKRAQALQNFAQENGLEFAARDSGPAIDAQTALFDRGSARRFRNMMTGKWGGQEISAFDYQYTINTGKSSTTIVQTVAAFTRQLPLAWFELRPEGFLDRVGEVFVHRDIDFDSNPQFSRRYMLRGRDEDAVRTLFAPALLSYLEMLPAGDQLHVEGDGKTLFLYRSRVQVKVENMRAFLDEMSGIAGTFFSSCGKPISQNQADIS